MPTAMAMVPGALPPVCEARRVGVSGAAGLLDARVLPQRLRDGEEDAA